MWTDCDHVAHRDSQIYLSNSLINHVNKISTEMLAKNSYPLYIGNFLPMAYIGNIIPASWTSQGCFQSLDITLDSSLSTNERPAEHEVKIEDIILRCRSLNSNASFTSQLVFSLQDGAISFQKRKFLMLNYRVCVKYVTEISLPIAKIRVSQNLHHAAEGGLKIFQDFQFNFQVRLLLEISQKKKKNEIIHIQDLNK